jgi:DNA-binding transcriptional MerR regulator
MHPAQVQLPDKLFYRIGEVAGLVGVKPHVLRYWESEFTVVRPAKTRANHRLYRRRDVEHLLHIKQLLHEERLTIEGARKRLRTSPPASEPLPESGSAARRYRQALLEVKGDLEMLRHLLR